MDICFLDLLADSLAWQGYKESGGEVGILMTGLSEEAQKSNERAPNKHTDTFSNKPSIWFQVGTDVIRIHHQTRLTFFTPEKSHACPVERECVFAGATTTCGS